MRSSNFRWIIVALVFFITVINYIDRSAISYAMYDITREFGFNASDAGLILGAFGAGYMVTTFLGGIWADHYGAHVTLFVASLLWSLSIGMTGLATGFVMLYTARVVLGVAEGPNFPVLNRAVADWLSSRERAIALSNSLMAVPLSLAIGAPVVSELVIWLHWRGMFIVLMVVGLAWVPLWWFLFRDFPEHSRFVTEIELRHIRDGAEVNRKQDAGVRRARRRAVKGLWKFLFSNRTLLANDWAFFVFGYFLFFFMTWLPGYLEQAYHMRLKEIGLFSILPWSTAALLLWGFGYLSDYLLRRTGSLRVARSHPIWISQLLAGLCVLPVVFTHNQTVALVFITLAVGLSMSVNAAFYAINVDVAHERSGTALGVMDTFFAVAGLVAPVVTGWLVERSGSFRSAFALLTVLAFSSVLAVLLFHRPDQSGKLSEA